MKWIALVLLVAASLCGCPAAIDEAAIASYARWSDWKMQQIVRLIQERNALPADSPRRAELDIQIGLERETLENALVRAFMRGISYTGPEGTLRMKNVSGVPYQYQVYWEPAQPPLTPASPITADPLPAGRSNAKDAPERFNTVPLAPLETDDE